MMTFRELFDMPEARACASEAKIYVNQDPVWDYKDQNGELRLIHEPVNGSERYGNVYMSELEEFQDLPVRSETLEGEITEYKLVRQGKVYKLIISI